jgi:hypothetical protein
VPLVRFRAPIESDTFCTTFGKAFYMENNTPSKLRLFLIPLDAIKKADAGD